MFWCIFSHLTIPNCHPAPRALFLTWALHSLHSAPLGLRLPFTTHLPSTTTTQHPQGLTYLSYQAILCSCFQVREIA